MILIPRPRLLYLVFSAFLWIMLGMIHPVFHLLLFLHYLLLAIAGARDILLIPKKEEILITRSLDKYLSLGARNRVILACENLSARPCTVILRDQYPNSFQIENDTVILRVDSRAKVSGEYLAQPARKGEYRFPWVNLRLYGGWGLIAKQYRFYTDEKALVYPNIIELKKFIRQMSLRHLQQIGYKKPIPGGETEFDYLREYLPGDDYRKIHWKATAKMQYPYLEVDEKEYNRNVIILLDTGRMMGTRYGYLSKLDYAVNAALILAAAALHRKDYLGMLTFSHKLHAFLPPTSRKGLLNQVLGALYRTEADAVKSDYHLVYRFFKQKVRKSSILYVFTELYNKVVSRELVEMLRLLSHQHRVNLISFEDKPETLKERDLSQAANWAFGQQQLLEKELLLRDLSLKSVNTIRVHKSNINQKVISSYLAR